MLDEDLVCDLCLKEAILRRFLFYPNHTAARVGKLPEGSKENCTICGGSGATWNVSILMGSLDKKKLIREREMILEAQANAKINSKIMEKKK
jgi:hypothetical protein